MGRIFAGYGEASGTVYSCKVCGTYLTCHKYLSSNNFHGSTGNAYLFKRAWNYSCDKAMSRHMLTGVHIVRDIKCIVCDFKLGWVYEYAYEESQTYKEGQVILELALIRESDPIEDLDAIRELEEEKKKFELTTSVFERPRSSRSTRQSLSDDDRRSNGSSNS